MGLFAWRKKDKNKKAVEDTRDSLEWKDVISTEIEKKKIHLDNKEDRISFLKDSCEQIVEASRQVDEAKVEYQAVTAYLTDMQKIENVSKEDREVLENAARSIITLTRERGKYQNREIRITDKQFVGIKKYETDMIKSMKQMQENETYLMAVKNDLRCLNEEKGNLKGQKKEILEKQRYLKNLSIITFALVGCLFLLFIAVSFVFHANMEIPYILTIALAAISSFYIFYEARKNRSSIVLVESKLNRAIGLLNKVKIKYVNTSNALDYTHDKFGVHSSMELQYLWEQYLKAKEEEERYRRNTKMLNRYNEILIEEMKRVQVADPEIWIYQAVAIIDQKEMVEIRHRLNVRRQKLRERIEYNAKLRDSGIGEMTDLVNNRPELMEEMIEILGQYKIII